MKRWVEMGQTPGSNWIDAVERFSGDDVDSSIDEIVTSPCAIKSPQHISSTYFLELLARALVLPSKQLGQE